MNNRFNNQNGVVRVYLAGPMTGKPEHNFPAFKAAAFWLRSCGYCVINPAELEAAETGPRRSWEYYLKRDIRELVTCDAVAVLAGWEDSKGACLEVSLGVALGMEIFDAIELESLNPNYLKPRHLSLNYHSAKDYGIRDLAAENNSVFPAGTTNAEDFVKAFTKTDAPKTLQAAILRGDLKDMPSWKTAQQKMGDEYLEAVKKIYQKPENILEEANRIVGGDRAAAYGHPRQDFERTAKLWSAILGIEITDMQVALCMIQVKVSRQCNALKRDNLVDIAGYARTAEMVAESHEAEKKAA